MRFVAVLLALCMSLAVAQAARAAEPTPAAGVPWAQLSDDQRKLLSDLEPRWGQMLARSSQRWLALPPEQRDEAREGFRRWQQLNAEQRREIRRRFQQFNDLPEDEQARIRDNYRRFRDLPPEQRQALRKRFKELTPEERKRLRERMREQQPN
jgi:hypothetical protein